MVGTEGLTEMLTMADGRTDFAAALARARVRAGLTQTELAEMLGEQQPRISSWEKAVHVPDDREKVFALERALGVPDGHLSRHLGYVPASVLEDRPPPTAEEVIARDPRLNDRDRHVLLDVLRTLLRTVNRDPEDSPPGDSRD